MGHILAVGNATLDIINVLARYPHEDEEVRAIAQHFRRGGNACNTLAVLSQLGHTCSWAGTLAKEADATTILDDLKEHGIDCTAVHMTANGKVPTSYISLSQENGSRTIVHFRDQPEYSYNDFARIDLSGVDWLHFEGRNLVEVERMMALARRNRPQLPISLEVEKPRSGIEALFGYADLLLFSRVYAQSRGFGHKESFLQQIASEMPNIAASCTWGEGGAAAVSSDGSLYSVSAYPPERVVDTLGAGDSFNAGMIDQLLRGRSIATALDEASRLAGKKCGHEGLKGLMV